MQTKLLLEGLCVALTSFCGAAAAMSYANFTVQQLRDMLAGRGLPKTGVKNELIARLEEDDRRRAAAGELVGDEDDPGIYFLRFSMHPFCSLA